MNRKYFYIIILTLFLSFTSEGFTQSNFFQEQEEDVHVPLPRVFIESQSIPLFDFAAQPAHSRIAQTLKREWIFIFYPTDEGGKHAFTDEPIELIQTMSSKFNVLYSAISDLDDALSYLQTLRNLSPNFKIRHVILGAHGNPNTLSFSQLGELHSHENHPFFKAAHSLMTPFLSHVLLLSCQTGGGADPIAYSIAQQMPGIEIRAPQLDVNSGSVFITELDDLEISQDPEEDAGFVTYLFLNP